MDITGVVTTAYRTVGVDERVSKLVGAFENPSVRGVVVCDDGELRGVVTRRQLAASHHPPDEKVGSLVWNVPAVAADADVREVARRLVDAEVDLLPVVEEGTLVGVVTADGLLAEVEPYLDAVTVAEAYSGDLVVVGPETTFGEALAALREHRITHLPVVEAESLVGMLSLHDVTALATREIRTSQGGEPPGFAVDSGSSGGGPRSHGGFGAREGERARMVDLPVRDVMRSPVATIRPTQPLSAAVEEMFAIDGSSLVVVGDRGEPLGIVTKTDVLRALTWGEPATRGVQVYGIDLLDDMTRDEVADAMAGFDRLDEEMTVLDAKLHLHEHDETLWGTPLLLARIRLYTDRGLFVADGEGYGARHAVSEAREALERRIRERKTYARTKKHPDADYWERRFGWWLEE